MHAFSGHAASRDPVELAMNEEDQSFESVVFALSPPESSPMTWVS